MGFEDGAKNRSQNSVKILKNFSTYYIFEVCWAIAADSK
jgi:hypothetical protein